MSCINDIEKLDERRRLYKEWQEEAKERRRPYKEWYEDNKERRRQYKIENKEHIATKNKEWYEANKDSVLQQKKEYRIENNEKLTQKTNCLCGGLYQYKHKSDHEKTKRHQAYLKFSGVGI